MIDINPTLTALYITSVVSLLVTPGLLAFLVRSVVSPALARRLLMVSSLLLLSALRDAKGLAAAGGGTGAMNPFSSVTPPPGQECPD